MFYTHTLDPPQVRTRCRNPRCSERLKKPTPHPYGAFCCRSCERNYFATRCRVCGAAISKKSTRREVCWRSKCRHALQRSPELFFGARYPRSGVGQNARKTSIKSSPKTGTESGRGWRADRVIFQRHTMPLNVIGGYKFPEAPHVDLGPRGKPQVPVSTHSMEAKA